MKKIIGLFIALFFAGAAAAQPVGQLPSGTVWGNSTAARAPASAATITGLIDRAISSTRGSVLTRNATGWIGLSPGTAGLPLLSAGTGADLAYGILGLSGGGSGANLTASNGGIVYSGASSLAILAGTATARQMLQSGASGAPSWSTTTWPATTTVNRLLWSSAANVISDLATANNGVLITSGAGVPSISSTLPSAVQANITGTGTLTSGATGAGFTVALTTSTITGNLPCANTPALSGGDVSSSAGSCVVTLATVNSNVGTFGSATQVGQFTVNGKGLITAASNVTITPAIGSVTGLGTGVATALAVNVGSAGAFVVNGGALGTPSSGVATNLTGTASGLTAGAVPASGITGTTLAANVVASSLTSVGTLTGGTLSTGVTIQLSNVSYTGSLAGANVAAIPNTSGSTSASYGVVKVDGTTITAASGVLTAVGAAATAVTVGTTTISSGTNNKVLSVTSTGCSGTTPCLAQIDAPNLQGTVLTSGTSWVTPANTLSTTVFRICLVGGGNTGGTGTTSVSGAGGGSGGVLCFQATGLSASTGYTYAVGSATGGNTTFTIGADTLTAGGGTAGSGNTAGTGGTNTTAGSYTILINNAGGDGQNGSALQNTIGGMGGTPPGGPGGAPGGGGYGSASGNAGAGSAAKGCGAGGGGGGSGSTSGGAGGAAVKGCVWIQWVL